MWLVIHAAAGLSFSSSVSFPVTHGIFIGGAGYVDNPGATRSVHLHLQMQSRTISLGTQGNSTRYFDEPFLYYLAYIYNNRLVLRVGASFSFAYYGTTLL